MARPKDFDEEEVLAKAIQVFWLKGYQGTSMQDLVNALGISRSSLYDTYTDKHTLFLKALERYRELASRQLQEILQRDATAIQTLRTLLEMVTSEMRRDRQHKGCFILNAGVEVAATDEAVGRVVCDNDRQMENIFREVVQKGKDSGEIRNQADARSLARFLLNAVKGMRVTARSTTDKSVFRDIIDLTLSVLT